MKFLEGVPLKVKVLGGGLILFLVIALISVSYNWYKEMHKPVVSTNEYVTKPEIPSVKKVPKKKVKGPETITTLDKEVLIKKVEGLPEWFKTDGSKYAIATSRIPAYEGYTDAIAGLDGKTGDGFIVTKQEPLSFFGLPDDKQLYAKMGFNSNLDKEVAVGASWKFLRIEHAKIGVYGEGRAVIGTQNDFVAAVGIIGTYDIKGK